MRLSLLAIMLVVGCSSAPPEERPVPHADPDRTTTGSVTSEAALGAFALPHVIGVTRLIRGPATVEVEVHCVMRCTELSRIEIGETVAVLDSLGVSVATTGGVSLAPVTTLVDGGWTGGKNLRSASLRQVFALPASVELDVVTITSPGIERRYAIPDFLRR